MSAKRNTNEELRKNFHVVKTDEKIRRHAQFMRGYNYVKRKQQTERYNKITFLMLVIAALIMMAITIIAGLQTILQSHAASAYTNMEHKSPIINVYVDTNKAAEATEDFNIDNERNEETKQESDYVPTPAPTYNGTRYSYIDQFKDWELVELQKLAVAEGGFTENAMQACAFSVIQTARDKNATISQIIGSGKYACVKDDIVTINGHEVTKKDYSKAVDAVRRAIEEGPGEIGEKLYQLVGEMELDTAVYYGEGPTYFYKEELLSSYQKEIRDNIKAKVYDEECGMYFYTYWDQPNEV